MPSPHHSLAASRLTAWYLPLHRAVRDQHRPEFQRNARQALRELLLARLRSAFLFLRQDPVSAREAARRYESAVDSIMSVGSGLAAALQVGRGSVVAHESAAVSTNRCRCTL